MLFSVFTADPCLLTSESNLSQHSVSNTRDMSSAKQFSSQRIEDFKAFVETGE